MRSLVRITLPIVALVLSATLTAFGQSPQDPQPNAPPAGTALDLLQQLHLTPDQIQRIRLIQRQTKDERQVIGDRLREANRALEAALDAETLDENLIEERMQALSTAQNAQMRMRIQTEVRIRRVLNPEQLAILREIHLKVGDVIRAQQQDNRRPLRPGVDSLRPNQRNGIVPLNPRRNEPIRNPRP
jgi:Spy/CpxP family protein refolding chaperone